MRLREFRGRHFDVDFFFGGVKRGTLDDFLATRKWCFFRTKFATNLSAGVVLFHCGFHRFFLKNAFMFNNNCLSKPAFTLVPTSR